MAVAARKSGIHRTTLWRWYKQWLELNQNVQLTNDNRPGRTVSTRAVNQFRLAACTWRIPTKSSRPHSCKHAVSEAVVDRIRYYRKKYGRCATIVHAYCVREGTQVSLATVRRVLQRLGFVTRKHYVRKWRPPVERPHAGRPGDLVQNGHSPFVGSKDQAAHLSVYSCRRLFTLGICRAPRSPQCSTGCSGHPT